MVKTRLQNQSKASAAGLRYSGPIDCFRKIVAAEGVGGLYQGLKPNLLGVAPEKSIKLAFNDMFREAFTARNGDGTICAQVFTITFFRWFYFKYYRFIERKL